MDTLLSFLLLLFLLPFFLFALWVFLRMLFGVFVLCVIALAHILRIVPMDIKNEPKYRVKTTTDENGHTHMSLQEITIA